VRIADNMNYTQMNQNIMKNRSESSKLQDQAATLKRVTKPSDDPVATTRALTAKTDMAGMDQYEKNINLARAFLEYSEQSLGDLNEALVRVKELAIGQANEAGANAITRKTVAAEIDQILNQVVQIGNRRIGERYLFGGFKTTAAPFSSRGEYHGDDGEIMIEIDKSSYIAMNMPGHKVFLGQDAASRSAFAEGKNVDRTPEGIKQTQLREAQEAEIAELKKTQGLKGPEVRGPASVLSAAHPEVPVGDDGVGLQPEGSDIFNVVRSLSIGLKSNDTTTIQESLERVDDAINQVVMSRAQVGSRVMALDSAFQTNQRLSGDAKALVSSQEDADVYQVFSDMSKNQTQLEATLNSSSKMSKLSLLDFLR